MRPLLIVLIAVLAVHYFLAVGAAYLLMKDKGLVKSIIPWNIAIMLVPVLGPLAYFIFRSIKKQK